MHLTLAAPDLQWAPFWQHHNLGRCDVRGASTAGVSLTSAAMQGLGTVTWQLEEFHLSDNRLNAAAILS